MKVHSNHSTISIGYQSTLEFQICTFMLNSSIGNAPAYLTGLLSEKIPSRLLRSAASSEG
jgi:hypothetical protein